MASLHWLSVIISIMTLSVKGQGQRSVNVARITEYDNLLKGDIYRLFLKEGISTKTLCAAHCLQDLKCVSFFHHQDEQWCQGHSVFFTGSENVITKTGSRYYQVYEDSCYGGGNGYINHRQENLCYKIYNTTLTLASTSDFHQNVVNFCSSRQEALISHLTLSQLHAVIRQFNVTSFKVAYIDGTDQGTEGTWHYSNGDVMDVLLWGPEEPENDLLSDHFVNLRLFANGDIGMSDTADNNLDFICQRQT